MSPNAVAQTILDEISKVMAQIDADAVRAACDVITSAHNIMLYGCGREGLQMQGLAMRFHHLGLRVCMQGDMAAPPIGRGDLFIVSAGPGELGTVNALMGAARRDGAEVLFLTAVPQTRAAGLATRIIEIPARTMAVDEGGTMPMGSAYEGALFVLGEVLVAELTGLLNQSPEDMRARHTNME